MQTCIIPVRNSKPYLLKSSTWFYRKRYKSNYDPTVNAGFFEPPMHCKVQRDWRTVKLSKEIMSTDWWEELPLCGMFIPKLTQSGSHLDGHLRLIKGLKHPIELENMKADQFTQLHISRAQLERAGKAENETSDWYGSYPTCRQEWDFPNFCLWERWNSPLFGKK